MFPQAAQTLICQGIMFSFYPTRQGMGQYFGSTSNSVNFWSDLSAVVATTDVKIRRRLCSCPCHCLFVYAFRVCPVVCVKKKKINKKSYQKHLWSNFQANVSRDSVALGMLLVHCPAIMCLPQFVSEPIKNYRCVNIKNRNNKNPAILAKRKQDVCISCHTRR